MDLKWWLPFWILVALAVGLVIWLRRRHLEQRRREALRDCALRLGFAFEPDADATAWLMSSGLPKLASPGATPSRKRGILSYGLSKMMLFSQGHSTKARNLMRGIADGLEVFVADYRYSSGHELTRTYDQTVAIVQVRGKTLPVFLIRPKPRLLRLVGGNIFPDYPEFSKSYLLGGTDEATIRSVFQPEVLYYFQHHKGWSVESYGAWLVAYRHANQVKPEELPRFVDEAVSIFRLLGRA